jgi:gamma-glutamyltranspeptidase / glutathione hydrolase
MQQILRGAQIIGLAACVAFAPSASAQVAPPAPAPIITNMARALPVVARNGMVVAQEKLATHVGVEILRAGGNAVDAAVAVGFTLAVTHPQAGNLGGGGFMLLHLAARNETVAIDYRETAPAAMTRDVFLDDKGEADPKKSRDSALGIGVPGTVAGLALAHEKYGSGKFTLAQLIAPAIRFAREGFSVDDEFADTLAARAATHRALAGRGEDLLEAGRRTTRTRRHARAERSRSLAGSHRPRRRTRFL